MVLGVIGFRITGDGFASFLCMHFRLGFDLVFWNGERISFHGQSKVASKVHFDSRGNPLRSCQGESAPDLGGVDAQGVGKILKMFLLLSDDLA